MDSVSKSSRHTKRSPKNSPGMPIAIVIASTLIAAAVYFNGQGTGLIGQRALVNTSSDTNQQITSEINISPVTENDHIRGNPNADVILVEYADYDCPFCRKFHETLNQIIDEYGDSGRVAWVYRHFPNQEIHPNGIKIAIASECVAEQGANKAFWEFSDLVFDRPPDERTDMGRLAGFAEQVGVDGGQFELCLNSEKYREAIIEEMDQAVAIGGTGTPYTVILAGNQQGSISGAQDFSVVKKLIDSLLSQIDGDGV